MAVRIGARLVAARLVAVVAVAAWLGACVAAPAPIVTPEPTPAPASSGPSPAATPTASASCVPTDQDRFVYNPNRLIVLASCIRVSGTVAAIRFEADGDLHILLTLDPAFVELLRPANQGEELGDLVIEPVCVRPVTQADAIATCRGDSDPMSGPMPAVGDHVWMEGRYVLDSQHGSWAELHPLYRWGPIGGPAASQLPKPTAAGSYGFYTPPGWDGHSDVDCADFDTHAHAQSFFIGTGGSKTYDPYRLDGDHDGLACERLP